MENNNIAYRTSIQSIAHPMGQCQRSWLEKTIPKEDRQEIIDTIVKMPTKQSKPTYSLWISGDQKLNEMIYLEAGHDPNNVAGTQYLNGQLSAPLLILFLETRKHTELKSNVYMNAGVAAGGAILRAHELGYKTGLCVCKDDAQIRRIIKRETKHSLRKSEVIISLGIGTPHPDYPRNANLGVKMDHTRMSQLRGPKEISVTEWC